MIRQCLVVPIILALAMTARFFYYSMETSKRVWLRHSAYSYNLNQTQNCVDKEFDAREMRLRIHLVKQYTTRKRLHREAVVIVGIPDGFSEVLGNIISRNAKVFYLPKVLNKLSYYMKHEPAIGFPLATALIDDVLKCKFEEKELLVDNLMQNKTRYLSRTLLEAPECVAKERYRATLTDDDQCIKAFSDWLTTECNHSDQVFIQTDQLKSISSLQVLMTESKIRTLSIRVVYVVRDPRAIIYDISRSVAKQLSADVLGLKSYRICTQMLLNIKTGETPPSWLQGRYLLIKVEDILKRSKEELAKVNAFLKTDIPQGDLQSLFHVQKLEEWRSEMPQEEVRLVEEKCLKVLKLLDYKILGT